MISMATAIELGEIQKFLRSELLERSREQLPPGPLYHYTDANGHLGIIKNHSLWATHFQYLNDSSEFIDANHLMKESVRDDEEAIEAPNSPRARLRHSILEASDEIEDNDEFEISDKIMKKWFEAQFVTCFSERGDGLSQWRGYGKSIGGYSLGFPLDHLRAVQDAINRKQEGPTIDSSKPQVTAELFRCWYEDSLQKKLIKEAFERAVSHCEMRGERLTDAELAALRRAMLRPFSPAYKDPAFEDEREWRLVIEISSPPRRVSVSHETGQPQEISTEQPREDKQDEMIVEFRSGEFTLIPYVAIPLMVDGSFGIAEVVVGPTPLPELARRAAIRYLRDHAPWVKVSDSEIPFRRV